MVQFIRLLRWNKYESKIISWSEVIHICYRMNLRYTDSRSRGSCGSWSRCTCRWPASHETQRTKLTESEIYLRAYMIDKNSRLQSCCRCLSCCWCRCWRDRRYRTSRGRLKPREKKIICIGPNRYINADTVAFTYFFTSFLFLSNWFAFVRAYHFSYPY